MGTGQLYETYRPLLFSLAYRMLGSVMDSEDIVHDVFVDWERVHARDNEGEREISQVKAYLCKMVTNRCIDQLRSARHRRETYVGAWLPDPLVEFSDARVDGAAVEREGGDPLQQVLLRDSLSVAYLIMLETLLPIERAVFLLREIFAYDYEEIAEMVAKKPDNCRQILRRAKNKISVYDQSSIYPSIGIQSTVYDPSTNQAVLSQFIRYVSEGNVAGLMDMIIENAVFTSDGGGKVQAAVHPVLGKDRVVRFVLGIAGKMSLGEFSIERAEINNEPGIIIFAEDVPYCTLAFTFKDEKITAIYNTMNPDKLQHVRRD